jgi:hypothetical protein
VAKKAGVRREALRRPDGGVDRKRRGSRKGSFDEFWMDMI